MPVLNQQSPDILCAEILADAQRQHDEILARAKTEAEALLATARVAADKLRRERLEQAQSEAIRRKELILATVAVEINRLQSARVETVLESVRSEIRRGLLAKNSDDRETAVALAAEAVRRMAEGDLIVEISAADHATIGNGLAQDIAKRAGRPALRLTISADGTVTDGGAIIRDAAGYQFWDNRLTSRLDRLWPELRRQIAIQASLVGDDQSTGGEA